MMQQPVQASQVLPRTSLFKGPKNTQFFERVRNVSASAPAEVVEENGANNFISSPRNVQIEILEPKRKPDAKMRKLMEDEYQELSQ